jgi:HEAT repeat protein
VQVEAIRLLGSFGTAASSRALRDLLMTSTNLDVRSSALSAIGWIGERDSLRSILDVLTDPGEPATLRGVAAESLANMGAIEALSFLESSLGDPDEQVSFWCRYALRELRRGDNHVVEAPPRTTT